MGKESRVERDRTCPVCKDPVLTNSEGFKTHVQECKEFERRIANLGIVRPGGIILTDGE